MSLSGVKEIKLGRRQRFRIDTIKNHTWSRTYGKVTKTQDITYRKANMSFLSQPARNRQDRMTDKHETQKLTRIHKTSTNFSVLCLLCLRARMFIRALWSPAGKGLTSWLSFVVSNCEFVTFPLLSWVRCGT